ncbi:MAG: ATP-binding protein [Desulfobacterales bacterium]
MPEHRKSLLDFARQNQPVRKTQNINQIVTDTLFLVNKQASFHDIKINADLSETLPEAYVDRDQIQQSLINLALNAIEATEPGGNILFTTDMEKKTGMIRISVRDTGCGIAAEDLIKIFDPFYTTRETGTGLDLPSPMALLSSMAVRSPWTARRGKVPSLRFFCL